MSCSLHSCRFDSRYCCTFTSHENTRNMCRWALNNKQTTINQSSFRNWEFWKITFLINPNVNTLSCRYILSLGCSERMEFLEQLRIQYETWDVRCDEKSIWRKNIASIVCLLRIWQRKINYNIFVSRLMLDNMYYHIFYWNNAEFAACYLPPGQ